MPQHPLPVPATQDLIDSQAFPREQQVDFLRTLAEWGNVRAAARRVGVSRRTAYYMRRHCPDFAQLWDAALLCARPRVEEVLADRALNGVEEQVFYHGEEVATRRRFDARLLLAHLGRLDQLERNRRVREATLDFESELAQLEVTPERELIEPYGYE